MPTLARWPGRIEAGSLRHVSAFWDLMPTPADLAGVKRLAMMVFRFCQRCSKKIRQGMRVSIGNSITCEAAIPRP